MTQIQHHFQRTWKHHQATTKCGWRSHVRNQSSKGHEHPSILSQLMDSDDWQCIHIHNSAEHYMRPMHSTVEEADFRIPVHVIDCFQAGYKTCVVISNYTEVRVLFRVPNFQELREHQFHFSKSISHQNLPPTSQGLEPPSYSAFYDAYSTMHVLDAQLHIKTGDLDPVD